MAATFYLGFFCCAVVRMHALGKAAEALGKAELLFGSWAWTLLSCARSSAMWLRKESCLLKHSWTSDGEP